MFNDDSFDTKHNQKQEEKWSAKKQKNPNFKIPYSKYSTYAGEMRFSKLPRKQEEYYERLKETKRAESLAESNPEVSNPETTFYDKIIPLIKEGMTEPTLKMMCMFNNKSYVSARARINQIFKR